MRIHPRAKADALRDLAAHAETACPTIGDAPAYAWLASKLRAEAAVWDERADSGSSPRTDDT
jgi:hypothetical protein